MTAKTADKKLARQLQQRGTWDSYSSCLREVQKWLNQGDWSAKEIGEMIDRGQLDPSKEP